MIKKSKFIYMSILICILFPILLTGCGNEYRYHCQDPEHWEDEDCKAPLCEVTETCPWMLTDAYKPKKP